MIETNVIAIAAGLGTGWPVVVSERIHPQFHEIGRFRGGFRRIAYPRAAHVVVQTDGIAGWMHQNLGVRPAVMPNPIDLAAFRPALERTDSGGERRKQALAIGRLDRQKGFDVLIDAFARIADDAPDWDLLILGEGPDRAALERQIRDHGLAARIRLPGNRRDIAGAFGETDLYVHPARYEGFPNAVMEAMASGCPIVAADSPGAARELLQDGRLGVLVQPDDAEGLSSAMAALMADAQARQTLGRCAAEGIRAYDAPLIAARWLELFRELVSPSCAA
jgi:glycosyltransferase involved in cell wall biosynthesis